MGNHKTETMRRNLEKIICGHPKRFVYDEFDEFRNGTLLMTERILMTDQAGLCTLSLNRPEKLNALDNNTFEELDLHLAAIETATDRIGCVIIKGEGRAFCAGADLQAMNQTAVPPEWKPGIIDRIASIPQPVIAAVHGVCFTGGLELVLAADFIIADSSARFSDTHGKFAMVGAWGMGQRLSQRIGLSGAKMMMMTSKPVDASEAQSLGLIDQLVDEGQLDEKANDLAAAILSNSWHTNFSVKRLMRETDGMPLNAGLAYERAHYPGFGPDHKERIAKFTAKRE